jgi:hypothetical protein
MKHVCTAVKISTMQQGIYVSKYLIMCTLSVKNVPNAQQEWSKR